MGLTDYEKYQLEWMIEHGHSLEDIFNLMDDIVDEEYHYTDRPLPSEAFEAFEEIGFKGSEIWVCEDEWKNNEALENNEFCKELILNGIEQGIKEQKETYLSKYLRENNCSYEEFVKDQEMYDGFCPVTLESPCLEMNCRECWNREIKEE